jgi:3'-5' exoribonuclease
VLWFAFGQGRIAWERFDLPASLDPSGGAPGDQKLRAFRVFSQRLISTSSRAFRSVCYSISVGSDFLRRGETLMAPLKKTILKLHELTPKAHGDFFALLSERNRGTTRENKPYFVCRFRDGHRTATAMIWKDSDWFDRCEKEWQSGMFFKIRANYEEHPQYGPQIDISNIRTVTDQDREDGFSEHDFLERSRFPSDVMLAELRAIAEQQIQDPPLKQLTLLILDRHGEKLKHLPATLRHYFPFPGGWLEHTLSVVKNSLFLVEKYQQHYDDLQPKLNRDLVVAGAILHEIGRVPELELPQEFGSPIESTVPGKLFGHLYLGRDLVRETAREMEGLNPELLLLLEHLILTHLTLPEWGSPRLPAIPEVLILHHADDLDAKFEMFARCLRKDVSDGPFTERDPILGKQLLKRREV